MKAYEIAKQKLESMGMVVGVVPLAEVTYWDSTLSPHQKRSIFVAAGFGETNPLTPWANLSQVQRQAVKEVIRKQVNLLSGFLGAARNGGEA